VDGRVLRAARQNRGWKFLLAPTARGMIAVLIQASGERRTMCTGARCLAANRWMR
jgi:hypothetical protein